MQDKRGEITIATGTRNIDKDFIDQNLLFSELKIDEYVFISISDTGSGIDEETMTKIFDPFFSTKFTGRGLGLAAAIGITRSHKGAIDVSSEIGSGSKFQILLPKND